MKHNQLEAAATQFNNVLALQPEHLEARFFSGVLHLESNQLDKAEQDFLQVLAIDTEHVNALINLGVTSLKREQGQLAIHYFTKALSIDNDNIDARNNLAATFIHHDRYENALIHYDILQKQNPQNIEYLYNAGVAQMALGHLPEATAHFETVLQIQKDHFAALNNLAAIHSRLGQREAAKTMLKRAIAVNPQEPASQFMLNALTGEQQQPNACPDYIKNLFNHYALYYDRHMQDALKYALPHQIARILHQINQLTKIPHAIDLGCGTGLTGSVMREISEHLTGVDLSTKMLASAKEKAIYDSLVEAELLSFLQENNQIYQLIIAADVLPYFGELDILFELIKNCLSPNGLFIFSTEISDKEPWKIQKSARFSHNEAYIKGLCEKNNFKLIHQETTVARIQEQQPLKAILYAVRARGQHC